MVMYNYQCSSCSYEFEALSKISERDKMTCERCGSMDTIRGVGYSGQFKINGYSADNGYSGILGNSESFTKQFGQQNTKKGT